MVDEREGQATQLKWRTSAGTDMYGVWSQGIKSWKKGRTGGVGESSVGLRKHIWMNDRPCEWVTVCWGKWCITEWMWHLKWLLKLGPAGACVFVCVGDMDGGGDGYHCWMNRSGMFSGGQSRPSKHGRAKGLVCAHRGQLCLVTLANLLCP